MNFKMRKAVLLITLFLVSHNISAQKFMKKIQLKEGTVTTIKQNDLTIDYLLQVYNEKSAAHLIGDISLRVQNNEETIAEFYIDNDSTEDIYNTKIYKNYVLTFTIENNNKYLIIEPAQFGKIFALSSHGSATVGGENDLLEIEITDFQHEWGYDAPPEDPNRNYFEDINYTLKVKIKDVVKNFNFSSSEIEDHYTIELKHYSILILSDKYKDSSSLIEMVIHKKEGK